MNLIAGIITLCVICAFAVGISMLIKKHPTTKVPPSNKTELWSDKQITELERILDNSFGNGSVLIPPSKLFTDEIKKCILDKMKLEYDGDEFEFMAANDINPDPNINTISDVELKFLLYMNKCASECFGYEWGKNKDDPIFNDEKIVNSLLSPGTVYKDINCAISSYKTSFSKLELRFIDFLTIIPESDSDPIILKDYRNYKNDILKRCLVTNKSIEEITFDTKPPGVDKYSMFMSETITPMAVQPVNPANYTNLVLPEYFNRVNNLNKASLFYIGKTDLSGSINNVNISGTFNIPDFITLGSQASYTIIILPPSGSSSTQQDFTEDSIINSAVIQPQVLSDSGNYNGDFSKNFSNVNTNIETNSDILLCVFGFNVVFYNVKIVLNGSFK